MYLHDDLQHYLLQLHLVNLRFYVQFFTEKIPYQLCTAGIFHHNGTCK